MTHLITLTPSDQVDAFPGALYKLFAISHGHFLVVVDGVKDDRPSDHLVQCFVAKLPPIHELTAQNDHWIHQATSLDPSLFDQNDNIRFSADGLPMIRWGSIRNYIVNAKFGV